MKKEHEEESDDLVIQGALFGADDRSPLDPLPHLSSRSLQGEADQPDQSQHSKSRAERSPHPIVTPHFRDQALWDDDADVALVRSHRSLPGVNALFGLSSSPSATPSSLSDAHSGSAHSRQTPQETTRKTSRRARLFRQRFEEAEKGEHAKITHRKIHDQPDTIGQGGRMVNREAQRSQLFAFSLLSEAQQSEVSHPSNEKPLDIVYGSDAYRSGTDTESESELSRPSSPADQPQAMENDVSGSQKDRSLRQYSHAQWIMSFSALDQAVRGPYSFDFSLSYEFWDRLATLIKNRTVILPAFTARHVLQQVGDPNLAQWITDLSDAWITFPDSPSNDQSYAQALGKVTGRQIAIISEMGDEESAVQPEIRSPESHSTKALSSSSYPSHFVSLTAFMRQARGF